LAAMPLGARMVTVTLPVAVAAMKLAAEAALGALDNATSAALIASTDPASKPTRRRITEHRSCKYPRPAPPAMT